MAITLNLSESLEKYFLGQAQKLGLSLETYIVDVLKHHCDRDFRPISNQGTPENPWIRGYMSRTSFELEGGGTDFRVFPSQDVACDKSFESRRFGSLEVKIEPLRQLSAYEPLENDFRHPPLEEDALLFYENVKAKIQALFEEHRPVVATYDHHQTQVRNAEEAITYWFDYFDRFQSPLGLQRAFSMAKEAILIHPRPLWIHRQALEVTCDLGLINERQWHLNWMEQIEAFHKELPHETFDMRKFDLWRYSKRGDQVGTE